MLTILSTIGDAVKCPMKDSDVDTIHRLFRPGKLKDSPGEENFRPRSVIVRLRSRYCKENFIAAYKIAKANRATPDDPPGINIRINGAPANLFFNEHLTAKNKDLFIKSKLLGKQKDFKFIWAKNGKVFMRKSKNSKILLIKSVDDLQNVT